MAEYRVMDLTTTAPVSDLVAIVNFERLGGYVEIRKDGLVRLISPAGTVSARFRELEKRDLLRGHYIQILLESGVRGAALEQALQAIARVDQRLAEETDTQAGIEDLEHRTEAHLRAWCEQRGIDYDHLSEDEFMDLVAEGMKVIRVTD